MDIRSVPIWQREKDSAKINFSHTRFMSVCCLTQTRMRKRNKVTLKTVQKRGFHGIDKGREKLDFL